MKFIELTSLTGDSVWVNMNNITCFNYNKGDYGSILYDIQNEQIYVRQTPDEICKLLQGTTK